MKKRDHRFVICFYCDRKSFLFSLAFFFRSKIIFFFFDRYNHHRQRVLGIDMLNLDLLKCAVAQALLTRKEMDKVAVKKHSPQQPKSKPNTKSNKDGKDMKDVKSSSSEENPINDEYEPSDREIEKANLVVRKVFNIKNTRKADEMLKEHGDSLVCAVLFFLFFFVNWFFF